MKIYGIYFSATNTTAKVVGALTEQIGDRLGAQRQMIDITTPSQREAFNQTFEEEDIVVFGSPVYIGRMPNLIAPFYKTIKGGGARCVAVALFGNRAYDNGLIELCDILCDDGFDVIAAGAFVGEHSFSRNLGAGRPDEKDMQAVSRFAEGIMEQLGFYGSDYPSGKEGAPERIKVPGEPYPYKFYSASDNGGKKIDIRKVKPMTDSLKCNKCGYCVTICPMGSINPADPSVVEGICIKCGACIKRCPRGAKYIDDAQFLSHLEMLEVNFARRAEPEFFFKYH